MTGTAQLPALRVSCADDPWLRRQAAQVATVIGGVLSAEGLHAELTAGDTDLLVVKGAATPQGNDEQFVHAAVLKRPDPREALVTRLGSSLADVVQGRATTVFVVVPSTRMQLAQRAKDIIALPVPSANEALRAVHHGEAAALIAPLSWLRANSGDAPDLVVHPLEHGELLHAPASSIVSVMCRRSDGRARKAAAVLDDANARAAFTAERELEFHITGDVDNTDLHVAGHAELRRTASGEERLVLLGLLITSAGFGPYRASHEVGSADATVLGRAMAATLLAQYQSARERSVARQHNHVTKSLGA